MGRKNRITNYTPYGRRYWTKEDDTLLIKRCGECTTFNQLMGFYNKERSISAVKSRIDFLRNYNRIVIGFNRNRKIMHNEKRYFFNYFKTLIDDPKFFSYNINGDWTEDGALIITISEDWKIDQIKVKRFMREHRLLIEERCLEHINKNGQTLSKQKQQDIDYQFISLINTMDLLSILDEWKFNIVVDDKFQETRIYQLCSKIAELCNVEMIVVNHYYNNNRIRIKQMCYGHITNNNNQSKGSIMPQTQITTTSNSKKRVMKSSCKAWLADEDEHLIYVATHYTTNDEVEEKFNEKFPNRGKRSIDAIICRLYDLRNHKPIVITFNPKRNFTFLEASEFAYDVATQLGSISSINDDNLISSIATSVAIKHHRDVKKCILFCLDNKTIISHAINSINEGIELTSLRTKVTTLENKVDSLTQTINIVDELNGIIEQQHHQIADLNDKLESQQKSIDQHDINNIVNNLTKYKINPQSGELRFIKQMIHGFNPELSIDDDILLLLLNGKAVQSYEFQNGTVGFIVDMKKDKTNIAEENNARTTDNV